MMELLFPSAWVLSLILVFLRVVRVSNHEVHSLKKLVSLSMLATYIVESMVMSHYSLIIQNYRNDIQSPYACIQF